MKDESKQLSETIYRSFLSKPKTPGIFSVSTKTHTPPLKIGQVSQLVSIYSFLKVRVKCNPQHSAQLHFVEGWVERTDLNSETGDHFEQLTS